MRIIHVLRKPLSEGTVAANTLKHGTGGLNIDATRVAHGSDVNLDAVQRQQSAGGGSVGNHFGAGSLVGTVIQTYSPAGRWPANVILQHLDGCRGEGTKRVKSDMDFPAQHGRGSTISGPTGHKGQDRLKSRRLQSEEVVNWICEPGCPVARLDAGVVSLNYGNTGGASRFYKQVGGSDE